jgi:hypothetical protein
MRKLILTAIMALTALALSAPTAMADSVLVKDAETGEPCSDVIALDADGNPTWPGNAIDATGGCEIGAMAQDTILLGGNNFCEAAANEVHVDSTGQFFVEDVTLNGETCFADPCDDEATSHPYLWLGSMQPASGGEIDGNVWTCPYSSWYPISVHVDATENAVTFEQYNANPQVFTGLYWTANFGESAGVDIEITE